jgi:hypothetical protein
LTDKRGPVDERIVEMLKSIKFSHGADRCQIIIVWKTKNFLPYPYIRKITSVIEPDFGDISTSTSMLSINSSASEIEDVFSMDDSCEYEVQIKKIMGQIEKQVEVIKAYYHTDEETIYQESCLFKIKSDLLFEEPQIQNTIKDSK